MEPSQLKLKSFNNASPKHYHIQCIDAELPAPMFEGFETMDSAAKVEFIQKSPLSLGRAMVKPARKGAARVAVAPSVSIPRRAHR